jgi:hypothetical protein
LILPLLVGRVMISCICIEDLYHKL